jgi:hypothetical protein
MERLSATVHSAADTNDFVHNLPVTNADYVYLQNNPGLGSIRAYESQDSPTGSNQVTVDVIGFIDDLNLLEFTNPQGGGFINSSIDLTPADATPLPAALPLFVTGLGALGLVRWRRKKKAAALFA